MNKTLVYILSSSHSGSTLLDLILSSNSISSSLGEYAHIVERVKDKKPICKLCGSDCTYWSKLNKELNKVGKLKYHDAAFNIFNTPVLIDSSKRIKWINQKTKSKKVDIKVIKITRYGLSTLLKTKRKKGSITESNVKSWIKGNKKIDTYMSRLKKSQKLFIKYEDLCNSPSDIVDKCCSFIGMPYEEGMLDFWKTKHHSIGGNAKPIGMVRLYHKMVKLEDMHPDVVDFFERNGFSLKLDTRFAERFSATEVKLFNRIAGKFCKSYGYECEL